MPLKKNMSYNEWIEYYKSLAVYQNLHVYDQVFFDQIFTVLFFNKSIWQTNEQLSSKFGVPKETLKKKLKRLEESKLIVRSRELSSSNNHYWTESREIKFNELTFPGIYK